MTGDRRVASTLSPVEIAFTAKTGAPKTQIFRPICQESDAEHVDVFFTHFVAFSSSRTGVAWRNDVRRASHAGNRRGAGYLGSPLA